MSPSNKKKPTSSDTPVSSAVKIDRAVKKDVYDKRATKNKLEKTDVTQKSDGPHSPTSIEPMLATLVDAPPDEPGWTYEIKWDGYAPIE